MLPRSDPTNSAPDQVSPQTISGSVSDEQRLGPTIIQRASQVPASTAPTVETGSGISTQESPGPFLPLPLSPFIKRRRSPAWHDPNHKAADYAYGFNFPPSPRSGSGAPRYEPSVILDDIHADVWSTYNAVSGKFDEERLMRWKADLDVLLIFVRLEILLVDY